MKTLRLLCAAAAAAAWGHPAAAADGIDAIFRPWDSQATPGCAVGIADGRRPPQLRSYGMADLEHGAPNRSDSIFEAGSVSKQFTAAAIMILAQDGALRLKDDIRRYLPEMPDYGDAITIDHLLTHTSGLRDWGSLMDMEGWPRTTRAMTQADVLALVARQRRLNFRPGAEHLYSNSGYNLLAIIAERVSGQSFAELSRRRIFEPLGMKSTRWRDDFRRIVPGRAIAYARREERYEQRMPFENAIGAGGLLTTVGDLLTWNQALTDRRLGAEVADMLERPAVLNDGRRIVRARGLRVLSRHGTPEISHAGATGAYRAWLGRFPDHGLSIAVLCNAGDVGISAGDLAYRVADELLPRAKPAPSRVVKPRLRSLAGLFVSEATGMPLRLVADGDSLRADDGDPLVPLTIQRLKLQDSVILLSGADRFSREDPDGNIEHFLRIEPSAPQAATAYLGRYESDEVDATYFVESAGAALVLRLDGRPGVRMVLAPAYRDSFLLDTRAGRRTAIVRFVRGPDQRITGFDFGWGTRVRAVRFERSAP